VAVVEAEETVENGESRMIDCKVEYVFQGVSVVNSIVTRQGKSHTA
jgi:hypothetical protein